MFKQYVDSGRERLESLREYREMAKKIKEIVTKKYEGAKVYVFGSVIKGEFTAASDVDILIVCDDIDREKASELKADILRSIGLHAPVELHIATTREFKEWYLKFIGGVEEI